MATPNRPGLNRRATNPNYFLGIAFSLTALNVMDRQLLAIAAGSIQVEFGLSDTDIGILTGFAFVIMHVLVGVPIASLADRTNRRNLIAMGILAWSTLTAATGLALSYTQIFVARVGVGIGEAAGSGPVQSMLSDYFPIERRAGALAINGAGGGFGAFMALLVGGFLVDSVGWRTTFFIFGAPGLVISLLLYKTVDEPQRGAADEKPVESLPLFEGLGRFLRMPSFWYLTLSASFNSFANYGVLFFLPTAMARLHGLNMGEAGAILAFAQAAPSFVGVIAAGFLADRLSRTNPAWHLRVPAIASVLAVPLGIVFLSIDSLALALPFCVAMAFFNTMWLGTGNAALQSVVHPAVRATAFSVLLLFSSVIGLGLGPALVGWASDQLAPSFGDACDPVDVRRAPHGEVGEAGTLRVAAIRLFRR